MNGSIQKISFHFLLVLAILVCFTPLLPGLLGLLFSAFSYIPALNMQNFSLMGFSELLLWPGLRESILITIFVSLSSTFLSALLAFSILQSCWNKAYWKKLESLLAPILALPHVAFAIGFAFLFTPTGFIARLLNTLFNDFSITHWSLINDPYGLGLILGLTIKEIPFLLFMSIPLLKQLNVNSTLMTAQSLGYSKAQTWQKIILPQWLPKIRFTLFAVMAYSLSVVDVALVIGPTSPATFPVLIWQWLNDPDLATLPKASAGALSLLLMCLVLLYLIRFIEWLTIVKYRSWQTSGRRALPLAGKSALLVTYVISLTPLPLLILWSFAQRWPFPELFPTHWSLRFWQQEWSFLWGIIGNSIFIALISATVALLFAIIIHEHSTRAMADRQRFVVPRLIISIPMLAPQLSILFGIQVATLFIAHQYYYLWVIWAHIFFVFPYVYLVLDGPWRSYDKRLDMIGLSLGMSPFKVWWKIKRPVLLPTLCIAWAVGISVSLAQYLPTLMLAGGRISTLTTEAVALASGQDRRISAIYALLQSLVPFFFYFLAIFASQKTGIIINQSTINKRSIAHHVPDSKESDYY
ncbi:ABC transporter permease protein [Psychromonas ingrahamii 37]|uniref:ABC transporter permease protein n=1 Tax=Psychromonas ingrahamii (strain DSM 17664 / CCUG 51855 / 37) TaxID=357804 RepID=A1SYB1_PSYIN|nr:thiamine ABC transporter permease [Psychromonas ingrahamii]ABM04476.1 ABC transporter permease protein [Psychromonas ingrahamii 37]